MADDLCRYGFTPREIEILKEVSKGKMNKEISRVVYLSPASISQKIHLLKDKAGVTSRSELVDFARSVFEPGYGETGTVDKRASLEQANDLLKKAVAILTQLTLEEAV